VGKERTVRGEEGNEEEMIDKITLELDQRIICLREHLS
jgi:cell division protein ZapA (FtsZ GTPase activity inhibitor)